MQPQCGVDDSIGATTNPSGVGSLLLSSARSMKMTHACRTQSIARALVSSASVLYAVVARDLDRTFACTALVIRIGFDGLGTVCRNTRSHRNDPIRRSKEIEQCALTGNGERRETQTLSQCTTTPTGHPYFRPSRIRNRYSSRC